MHLTVLYDISMLWVCEEPIHNPRSVKQGNHIIETPTFVPTAMVHCMVGSTIFVTEFYSDL